MPQDRFRAVGASLAGRPEAAPNAKTDGASAKPDNKEDDDSDDDEGPIRSRPKVVPLEAPEIPVDFAPVLAEDVRQPFERYMQRVPERFSSSTECAWEKLQSRAAEHLLGAHVGKLEFFWMR